MSEQNEFFGSCPHCGKLLDPWDYDVYLAETDSKITKIRKLLDEHFKESHECLLRTVRY